MSRESEPKMMPKISLDLRKMSNRIEENGTPDDKMFSAMLSARLSAPRISARLGTTLETPRESATNLETPRISGNDSAKHGTSARIGSPLVSGMMSARRSTALETPRTEFGTLDTPRTNRTLDLVRNLHEVRSILRQDWKSDFCTTKYENKIPIYNAKDLLENPKISAEIAHKALSLHGPGVAVVRGVFTEKLISSIDEWVECTLENESGEQKKDHFSSGNKRIWRVPEKMPPQLMFQLLTNKAMNDVVDSFLGCYHLGSFAVNQISPGGMAQDLHTDYPPGFFKQHEMREMFVNGQEEEPTDSCETAEGFSSILADPTILNSNLERVMPYFSLQCGVAISRIVPENGATEVIPFSHQIPGNDSMVAKTKSGMHSDTDHKILHLCEKHLVTSPILEPGDCLFFNRKLFHRGGHNRTDKGRTALLLQAIMPFGVKMEQLNADLVWARMKTWYEYRKLTRDKLEKRRQDYCRRSSVSTSMRISGSLLNDNHDPVFSNLRELRQSVSALADDFGDVGTTAVGSSRASSSVDFGDSDFEEDSIALREYFKANFSGENFLRKNSECFPTVLNKKTDPSSKSSIGTDLSSKLSLKLADLSNTSSEAKDPFMKLIDVSTDTGVSSRDSKNGLSDSTPMAVDSTLMPSDSPPTPNASDDPKDRLISGSLISVLNSVSAASNINMANDITATTQNSTSISDGLSMSSHVPLNEQLEKLEANKRKLDQTLNKLRRRKMRQPTGFKSLSTAELRKLKFRFYGASFPRDLEKATPDEENA